MLMLVKLKVKDGAQAEFERRVGELIEVVKAAEPGVLTYTLGKAAGDPTEYWMIEHFASEAAHEAHVNAPHFKASMADTGALLDGAPERVAFERAI